MLHRSRMLAPLLLSLIAPGCGDGRPDLTKTGPKPAHGGELALLPDNLGYVEIVKGDGKGPEVAFYFLKPDGTPFVPSSGSGNMIVGKAQVPLKAEGGGLVMPPGIAHFAGGVISGDLKTGHDGKSIVIPIGLR